MIRDYSKDGESEDDNRYIVISPYMLVGAILVISVIAIVLGVGGLYPQAGDWYKHNAVLRDLTFMEWPVYYTKYDNCMLTYYLGQYLLPAFIGKICNSFEVSNIVMAIWGIAGLVLCYIHLVRKVKANGNVRKQLVSLLFMLFFCGALNLCQNVINGLFGSEMYSLGQYHWILISNIMLQYRSNLIMIRWVFPQVIVPWMVTMMFVEHKDDVKHYMALILPTIMFGTFSFGALAVIAVIYALFKILKHDITIKGIVCNFNTIIALTSGVILFFYFFGYMQVKKPVSSSFRWQIYQGKYIWVYLLFCFFMFGIYAICTWKENRREPLWYINLAVLMFLPWCRMGLCNDVVMSGSIPSLFYLMISVLMVLFKDEQSQSLGIRKGIIIATFLIGCWYPALELRDNVVDNTQGMNLGDGYFTMTEFTDRSSTEISEDLLYNYYTYNPDGKIFYEYIARKKIR